jgi:hypothetical protein
MVDGMDVMTTIRDDVHHSVLRKVKTRGEGEREGRKGGREREVDGG